MPRIEVIARWQRPEGIYESLIGSVAIGSDTLTRGGKDAVIAQVSDLLEDVVRYEEGPPTCEAKCVMTTLRNSQIWTTDVRTVLKKWDEVY